VARGPAPSPEQAFAEAVAHYEHDRFEDAEAVLREIEARHPGLADVSHLRGLIALRTGRAAEAAGHLERAAAAAPGSAEIWGLLGGARKEAGDREGAVAAYGKATGLDPARADLHFNLANGLRDLGRAEDAVASYAQAVELDPDFADAQYNLALALKDAGRLDDALKANERALELNPGDADALINLGNVLQRLDRMDDAVAAFERAVRLGPDRPEALNNLANAHRELGRLADAVAGYEKARALAPGDAEILGNLGGALRQQGSVDEAARVLDAALGLAPGNADVLCNLAGVRVDQGRLDDARALYDRALAAEPGHVRAHVSKSALLLLTGDLAGGWEEAAWRWRVEKGEAERPFPQPQWRGENVDGKTVLVTAEQGVGEEILFAGMVPDLLDAGARVVLECDERLMPLFERSFAGVRCVAWRKDPAPETKAPDIDVQIPGGALGRWLRADFSRFPGRASYLLADEAHRNALRTKYLGHGGERLVGIAWLSRNRDLGLRKSMTLADWAPLAAVPGVRLVDLQYGDTAAERRKFEAETGVGIVHDDGVDQMADLDAFAAQVAAMDLVVSISNTTVHMAGALGVPTWVLLNSTPLSWWFLEREDSPWYPSVRLFRQTAPGDWAGVVARVADALRAETAKETRNG